MHNLLRKTQSSQVADLAKDIPTMFQRKIAISPTDAVADEREIVESNTTQNHEPGYGFRGWHYATAKVRFGQEEEDHDVCFDTGCSVTLID